MTLVGKWHLGYPPHFRPCRSCYKEVFGPLSGGVDYFTHCGANCSRDLYLNEEETRRDGYLTDLLSRQAVDYIDRVAGAQQPSFLSLHYTAPHCPWGRARTRMLPRA